MAKIRAIHPGFWNDTTLAECSPGARLFYIGLWSFADDAGVFEWHEKLLKSQIFPFDDKATVSQYIEELVKCGRIGSLLHNGKKYGLILNFTKYQKPDSRYVKYTIGDSEHVNALFHAGSTTSARGAPPTEGEGVIEGDGEGGGEGRAPDVVDREEAEYRQFLPIVSEVLGRQKVFTLEGLAKWKARRQKWSAREITEAFLNLRNEPDHWKILNVGQKELSWWLRNDDYIRELQNCHLKRGSGPKVRVIS